MRDRYQGGSLASFIIVGVLLALVLVGGLYGLNRYNAEKTADTSSDQASNDKKQSEEKKSEASKDDGSSSSNNSSGSSTHNQTPPQTSQSQPQSTASNGSSLPQTGPADTAYGMFVVTVVVFAGAHYLRSRKLAAERT